MIYLFQNHCVMTLTVYEPLQTKSVIIYLFKIHCVTRMTFTVTPSLEASRGRLMPKRSASSPDQWLFLEYQQMHALWRGVDACQCDLRPPQYTGFSVQLPDPSGVGRGMRAGGKWRDARGVLWTRAWECNQATPAEEWQRRGKSVRLSCKRVGMGSFRPVLP